VGSECRQTLMIFPMPPIFAVVELPTLVPLV